MHMFTLYLYMFILVFFTLLILYSLLFNDTIVEGLNGACNNNPVVLSKVNENEIEKIKIKMADLKGIKSRVDSIEAESNLASDGLKKMKEEDEKAKEKAKEREKERAKEKAK